MIYYELNESLPQSKLPQAVIDRGVKFENLEEITGADFVVVPETGDYEKAVAMQDDGKNLIEISKELGLDLQETIELINNKETALHKWLFSGAILVQRKSGFDFVQSIGPRLNHSIAKMCEVSHKQYQRVILATGIFTKNCDMLEINGRKTQWNYGSFQGALSSIKFKGCCVEFVPDDSCILNWVETQERQILAYKREDIKWIVPTVYYPPDLPELDDPLQLMRPVRDARLSIIHIPGWGSEKVNMLYNYVRKSFRFARSPTLLELLHYATSWETANHLRGVGKTLIKNAREYIGLKEGEYICVSKNNVSVQTVNAKS